MILLAGRWDSGGNLVVESSRPFPEGTTDEELDAEADANIGCDANGWAGSFRVSSHRAAVLEAYLTYVLEPGDETGDRSPELIDKVHHVQASV